MVLTLDKSLIKFICIYIYIYIYKIYNNEYIYKWNVMKIIFVIYYFIALIRKKNDLSKLIDSSQKFILNLLHQLKHVKLPTI